MNAVELVAKLKATDQEPPRTYKADILAINDLELVLWALSLAPCTFYGQYSDCPRRRRPDMHWCARCQALTTVAEHAQEALIEEEK